MNHRTVEARDALACLGHLEAVLDDLQRQCEAAAPAAIPAILAHERDRFYAAMDALGGALNEFLKGQSSATALAALRNHVTLSIRPLSATGPFFDRSFGKLRGYPGDFETIEMIYRCRPSGASLSALIFDDYYLHTVAAQSVRNRLAFLVEWLAEQVQMRSAAGRHAVRLLSLGSGPARELVVLSQRRAFAQAVQVTCVDLDAEALRYARDRIGDRLNGRAEYRRANVLRYLTAPDRPQPGDVIYAAGLFDYLDVAQAARLISECFDLLAPDGALLIGNFCVELPANERVLIEWLLDWRLLYRSEEDYRAIFRETPFGVDRVKYAYEPLRGNIFAVASKG